MFKTILGLLKRSLYRCWDLFFIYSGIGWLIEKIHIPTEEERKETRRPSGMLFWLIGIYVGLFGISYQRYENSLNRLYGRVSSYGEHLDYNFSSSILQDFVDLQNVRIPIEPEFESPLSVFKSINSKYDEPLVELQEDIGTLASQYVSNLRIIELENADFGDNVITINNFSPMPVGNYKAYDLKMNSSKGEWVRIMKPDSVDILMDENEFKEIWISGGTPRHIKLENNSLESLRLENLDTEIIDLQFNTIGQVSLEDSRIDKFRYNRNPKQDSLEYSYSAARRTVFINCLFISSDFNFLRCTFINCRFESYENSSDLINYSSNRFYQTSVNNERVTNTLSKEEADSLTHSPRFNRILYEIIPEIKRPEI